MRWLLLLAWAKDWRFLGSYPRHYVAQRLGPGTSITIDGDLSDAAWRVPTLGDFDDIAQPLFPAWRLPPEYRTTVKAR